jgi:hypothetical protein
MAFWPYGSYSQHGSNSERGPIWRARHPTNVKKTNLEFDSSQKQVWHGLSIGEESSFSDLLRSSSLLGRSSWTNVAFPLIRKSQKLPHISESTTERNGIWRRTMHLCSIHSVQTLLGKHSLRTTRAYEDETRLGNETAGVRRRLLWHFAKRAPELVHHSHAADNTGARLKAALHLTVQ